MKKDNITEMKEYKYQFTPQCSQVLKGIAVLMMMFHHTFRTSTLYEQYTISFFPFSEHIVVLVCDFFKICVPFFVFVSGYGLYLSYKKSGLSDFKWAMNRYLKTFSGFWFVFIVSSVLCQLMDQRFTREFFSNGIISGIPNVALSFLGLSNLFGTNNMNGTWWYMSAARVYIFLTPLIIQMMDEFGGVMTLIFVVIIPRLLKIPFTGGNSVYPFLFIFIAGMYLAEDNKLNKYLYKCVCRNMRVRATEFIIHLLIALFTVKLYVNTPSSAMWEISWGVIPLIWIIFAIKYIYPIFIFRKLFGFLGTHSMNIFLVHTFFNGYYRKNIVYSFKHFIFIALFLLCIGLLVSVVIECIKKIIRYDIIIEKLQLL